MDRARSCLDGFGVHEILQDVDALEVRVEVAWQLAVDSQAAAVVGTKGAVATEQVPPTFLADHADPDMSRASKPIRRMNDGYCGL